jgi:hypothetical protein
MKNNNENDIIKIDEKPKYFKITKFIYDIKPFKSENGFFILITQNPIRPINMNIIYKINYTNLIPIENDFSEGLIIGLRNPRKKVEFINQYNNFLFNKRYNYFINKIFKGQVPGNKDDKMNIEEDSEKSSEMQEEKNDEEDNDNINDDIMNINSEKYKNMEKIGIKNNEIIKNEIIDFFLKKYEKSLSKDEYLKYINNNNFLCEFCGDKFISFDKTERIYKCSNDDICFCCCLSNKPINNNFIWCSYCNLFYSQELKIYYCIVCDKILTNLDSI